MTGMVPPGGWPLTASIASFTHLLNYSNEAVRHGEVDTLRGGLHRSGCHPLGGAGMETEGAEEQPRPQDRRAPDHGASPEGDARGLGASARKDLRDDGRAGLVEAAAAAQATGRGTASPSPDHRSGRGGAPAVVGRGRSGERFEPVSQASLGSQPLKK